VSLFTPDDMNEPYDNGGKRGPNGWEPSCGWQALHSKSKKPGAAAAVLFSQPCSWGALYFPEHWARFLEFASSLRHLPSQQLPKLSCPATVTSYCKVSANHWGRSSWKRLMVYFMIMEGLYMVFPNFAGRVAFSTNHVEPGVHLAASPAILSGQRSRHRTQLMTLEICSRYHMRCEVGDPTGATDDKGSVPFGLPSAGQIALYDFYCAPQPAGEAGFQSLALAGEALAPRARKAAQLSASSNGEDPSKDGSAYVSRDADAATQASAKRALQLEL